MNHSATPSVLFVCVKNCGKSQMAKFMMWKITGNSVDVHSAGTKPGREVNKLRAGAAEVGVDISKETPKPVDPELVRDVDIVVTLGREAHVEPLAGTRFENWDTDEPAPNVESTASNACGWFETTSPPASPTFRSE